MIAIYPPGLPTPPELKLRNIGGMFEDAVGAVERDMLGLGVECDGL
jgi:hypothetical protein